MHAYTYAQRIFFFIGTTHKNHKLEVFTCFSEKPFNCWNCGGFITVAGSGGTTYLEAGHPSMPSVECRPYRHLRNCQVYTPFMERVRPASEKAFSIMKWTLKEKTIDKMIGWWSMTDSLLNHFWWFWKKKTGRCARTVWRFARQRWRWQILTSLSGPRHFMCTKLAFATHRTIARTNQIQPGEFDCELPQAKAWRIEKHTYLGCLLVIPMNTSPRPPSWYATKKIK